MQLEDTLEGDGYYATALIESEEDVHTVVAADKSALASEFQSSVDAMSRWFSDPAERHPDGAAQLSGGGAAPVESAESLAAKIACISSMRAYLGGGLTQSDIAERVAAEEIGEVDMDSTDDAVAFVAATADRSNHEVRAYIDALSAILGRGAEVGAGAGAGAGR